MDSYDAAVESALEREEDVEAYLKYKTTDPFQLLLERCNANLKRKEN